jgi:hypothetical protein
MPYFYKSVAQKEHRKVTIPSGMKCGRYTGVFRTSRSPQKLLTYCIVLISKKTPPKEFSPSDVSCHVTLWLGSFMQWRMIPRFHRAVSE